MGPMVVQCLTSVSTVTVDTRNMSRPHGEDKSRMKRWTHSKGCKVEFDVATAIGLDVYFEECDTMIKFT